MHYALFYVYVPDMVNRRAPYREAHLALVRTLHADGRLLMAGAWADPVDGALFVFKGEDKSVVDDFVANDPYVKNGLVTTWRHRAWTIAVGAPA